MPWPYDPQVVLSCAASGTASHGCLVAVVLGRQPQRLCPGKHGGRWDRPPRVVVARRLADAGAHDPQISSRPHLWPRTVPRLMPPKRVSGSGPRDAAAARPLGAPDGVRAEVPPATGAGAVATGKVKVAEERHDTPVELRASKLRAALRVVALLRKAQRLAQQVQRQALQRSQQGGDAAATRGGVRVEWAWQLLRYEDVLRRPTVELQAVAERVGLKPLAAFRNVPHHLRGGAAGTQTPPVRTKRASRRSLSDRREDCPRTATQRPVWVGVSPSQPLAAAWYACTRCCSDVRVLRRQRRWCATDQLRALRMVSALT